VSSEQKQVEPNRTQARTRERAVAVLFKLVEHKIRVCGQVDQNASQSDSASTGQHMSANETYRSAADDKACTKLAPRWLDDPWARDGLADRGTSSDLFSLTAATDAAAAEMASAA
jgi:hypothetical protein